MIEIQTFGQYKGQEVHLFFLRNDFLEVGVLDFGGIIQSFRVLTPNGKENIVFGIDSIAEYLEENNYSSAIIGRVANCIQNAAFSQNGVEYHITKNEGANCNHGGIEGFDKRVFSYEIDGDVLALSLLSPDGDQGFAGNLSLRVEYRLSADALDIKFIANSDADTVFAPTAHPYFHLSGQKTPIYDSLLTIYSKKYAPLNEDCLPDGTLHSVIGTPFDFSKEKAVGADIFSADRQLELTGGYDHCYAVDGEHHATLRSSETGICLDIFSDLPGVQFYTANDTPMAKNSRFFRHCAVCLEPQFFPNAVNIPAFESPILPACRQAEHYIRYVISINSKE